MRAIVVMDRSAGAAGMALAERPAEPREIVQRVRDGRLHNPSYRRWILGAYFNNGDSYGAAAAADGFLTQRTRCGSQFDEQDKTIRTRSQSALSCICIMRITKRACH
jgi:hypothetical protein